jgi:hypothetical protein
MRRTLTVAMQATSWFARSMAARCVRGPYDGATYHPVRQAEHPSADDQFEPFARYLTDAIRDVPAVIRPQGEEFSESGGRGFPAGGRSRQGESFSGCLPRFRWVCSPAKMC